MQTQKLFYEDCHLRSFSAKVTACTPAEGGFAVELDRTAFYPEGGGQACDTGMLGGVKVLSVREKEDRILHLCDGPLGPGQTVVGQIHWERRFDQMQQHAGEHIVSGIINARYGYHNVGFHVGADTVTIDFDGMIPPEALEEIEWAANRVVWQNLSVRCWYPSREELPGVAYRSKKALPWPVRIVQIPGVDSCACCGIHVEQTGEIGIVKLLSCVKFHQGVRIEMACGGRALKFLQKIYEQNRQVSQAFSAKVLETGEAARKMNETLAAEKFRSAALEKQVFDSIAAGFAGAGDVLYFAEALTSNGVRELADRMASQCGGTAAVFSGGDETGYSVCLVNKQGDVKELGQKMSSALQGRGGGKPGFFQGSVRAPREKIEAFFKEAVK
ncbi:MAG: alanyl-tRNA editing protein [Oscillospiraceae bacterium]|nr:alanyl-tRNA editing protein [Oscillospiraceae bacterium]